MIAALTASACVCSPVRAPRSTPPPTAAWSSASLGSSSSVNLIAGCSSAGLAAAGARVDAWEAAPQDGRGEAALSDARHG